MRKDMRPVWRASWIGLIVTAVGFSLLHLDSRAEESDSVSVDVNLFASAVLPEGGSIVVGDRGKIFLSEDGARTWEAIHSGTKKALMTVCFPDDRHGWAAGQGGVIVHSSDGGRTWETQASGVEVTLLAIDFFDPRHGLAVGADSTVVATTDGGRTWRSTSLSASLELFEEVNLFAVAMTDEQKACVTGDGGRIFTTEDGGQSWVQAKSPLYDEEMMEGRILYAMAYDAGTLYAVGIDGAFVTSKDQGNTWVEGETGFPGPELFCIDVEGGVGLAGGSGGHVIQTSDGGLTWTLVEVPEEVTRYWLSGVDLQKTPSGGVRGLIVGQEGTSGRLESGTLTW
jgi:photosystem II stability/assembly factor-like uncharacterized protein